MTRTVALTALVLVTALGIPAAAAPDDARAWGGKLKHAVAAGSADGIEAALTGLIETGGEKAFGEVVKLVAAASKQGGEAVYWQLVSGAAGFRDREALSALGNFLAKKGKKAPFARDLLFGLESNTSPNVVAALGPVLAKGPFDMQLMAADQLAMVRTTASVDLLIDTLKKEGDKGDPELRRRVLSSLQTVTKQDMGDSLNWIGWWEANRSKGVPEPEEAPISGEFASSTMNRDRQGGLESVTRTAANRILVIVNRRPDDDPKEPGRDYDLDHMEKVLDGMKIPHTVVRKVDFEEDPDKYLAEAWTVLVNCNYIQTQCICPQCRDLLAKKKAAGQAGSKKNRLYGCPPECSVHDRVTYRLKKQTIDRLKEWVEQGGYLFTEDWGLIEIVEVAWPKLVTSQTVTPAGSGPGGSGEAQANLVSAMDVKIVPGRGMTSRPILRGVFTRPRPPAKESDDAGEGGTRVRDLPTNPANPPTHSWKIDDESPSIQVKSAGDVTVLIRSEELGKVANGDDAVAVTFRAGRGGAKKPRRKGPVTGGGGGKSRGRGAWSEALTGGRVLHVMSHFGKQQASVDDTFVLQNLILNFIMESDEQHKLGE